MIHAIDCDLRAIYCMREDGAQVWNDEPNAGRVADWARTLPADDTLLFEIASAQDYLGNNIANAAAVHKRRWMIYNAAVAGTLLVVFPRLLVAPSSKWTRGLQLAVRHKLAGADARNKDLRECQAMIYFYKNRPQDWVPLGHFLAEL